MNPALREAIVSGDANITISVNAADLRSIVCEMAHAERTRIAEEIERSKEQYVLTREEVAKQLKITLVTLWKREKDGSLTPKRIGSKVFYRQSDIDAYLDNQ